MTEKQDKIERIVVLKAPIERVYRAITDPKEWGTWFAHGVEGDFEPGSQPVMDEGEYGRFRIAIIDVQPHHYFAFRWVSGSEFVPQGFVGNPLEHPNTLVEFFLNEIDGCTELRLVESGFAGLPDKYAEKNFNENCDGWEYQLNSLTEHLNKEMVV